MRDLSHEAHFRMQVLLLPSNPGRDWKTLADKMGFPREEILYFDCRQDPVLELISGYESKGKTISELLSLLEEMERFDVIEDLKKFTGELPLSELITKLILYLVNVSSVLVLLINFVLLNCSMNS